MRYAVFCLAVLTLLPMQASAQNTRSQDYRAPPHYVFPTEKSEQYTDIAKQHRRMAKMHGKRGEKRKSRVYEEMAEFYDDAAKKAAKGREDQIDWSKATALDNKLFESIDMDYHR